MKLQIFSLICFNSHLKIVKIGLYLFVPQIPNMSELVSLADAENIRKMSRGVLPTGLYLKFRQLISALEETIVMWNR